MCRVPILLFAWIARQRLGVGFYRQEHRHDGKQTSWQTFMVKRIERDPTLQSSPLMALKKTQAEKEAERVECLKSVLSLNDEQVSRMVKRFPVLLNTKWNEKNLDEKIRWLTERLGTERKNISKMIQHQPATLLFSMQANVEKLDYLQERFSLSNEELLRLLFRSRHLINLTIGTIKGRIEFLQSQLAIDDENLKRIVIKGRIMEKKSETTGEKLEFLRNRLRLGSNEELMRLVRRRPGILCCSVEGKLEPKLNFFQTRLGLTNREVRDFVLLCPACLEGSIEKAEATIDFLESAFGADTTKEFLLGKPGLILHSIEERYKPRLEQAQQAGLTIDFGAISRIAIYTDKRWAASLEFQKKKLLKSNTR